MKKSLVAASFLFSFTALAGEIQPILAKFACQCVDRGSSSSILTFVVEKKNAELLVYKSTEETVAVMPTGLKITDSFNIHTQSIEMNDGNCFFKFENPYFFQLGCKGAEEDTAIEKCVKI